MTQASNSTPPARPGRSSACHGLLLIAAAVVLGGCSSISPPPLSEPTISLVKHFQPFPVYWIGRRFEGIAITAADRPRDYERSLGMRIYYGDCLHRHALFGSGGCTLPLEINTVLYKPHSNVGLGTQRATRIRGVPAVIYDRGDSIELYTGRVAIDVFADNPGRAMRAALAVRAINRRPTRGSSLPPPHFHPGAVARLPVPDSRPSLLPRGGLGGRTPSGAHRPRRPRPHPRRRPGPHLPPRAGPNPRRPSGHGLTPPPR